ncbi:MAG: hypothetical protein HC822_05780 [Oscillochloris sp.]|nr:hypothetical protein [Oscillochloris sp.]
MIAIERSGCRAILHESMGQWAQAEVGVALCRSDDARGPMMVHELASETVAAWAQIELACDMAASDEAAALARIMALPAQNQRDRGLARLSHTLAYLQKDGDALSAAEAIQAVEVRVAALIDLRLNLDGLVAMLALERATSDIAAVMGDNRTPLLAALAAALAALGRADRALGLLEGLEAGEERNRGLARVAVSLAYGGERDEAYRVLALIDDDDELDWARDEIARQFGSAGYWEAALAQVGEILSDEQRLRTLADLAIVRARAGHALPALGMALGMPYGHDQMRALTLIAPALVHEGQLEAALRVADQPGIMADPEGYSRYLATLAMTLAEVGRCDEAEQVAARTLRSLDRARAELAIAAAHLASDRHVIAHAALGRAFCSAAVGREEAYRTLELAAPLLATFGGAALLREVATALALIDRR